MNPPKEFLEFVRHSEIPVDSIIHVHEDKQRVVAKIVRADSRASILKWNDPHNHHNTKLRQEIDTYKKLAGKNYVPELLSFGENFIELSYIEGATLRDFLVRYATKARGSSAQQDPGELRKVIQSYSKIVRDLGATPFEPGGRGKKTIKSIVSIVSRLLSSGPAGTSDKQWSKQVLLLYKERYRRYAENEATLALSSWPQARWDRLSHADFHLNNIIVSADRQLFVVDWENAKADFELADALYSAAMIRALLKGHPEELALFESLLAENSDADPGGAAARERLSRLCAEAISINPRFHLHLQPARIAAGHTILAIKALRATRARHSASRSEQGAGG